MSCCRVLSLFTLAMVLLAACSLPAGPGSLASASPHVAVQPFSSAASTAQPATSGLRSPASSEPGVCGGDVCGPSAGFTVADFATIAGVDFASFPPNPARPYQPVAAGRTWYVSPSGSDAADGAQTAPLRSIEQAIARARAGDLVLVADGQYQIGSDESGGLNLRVPHLTLAAEHPGAVSLAPAHPDVTIGIVAEADDLVIDGFIVRGFRDYGVYFGRLSSPQRSLVLKHLVVEGSSDGIRSAIPETAPHEQPIVRGVLLYDVWIRDVEVVGFNCGEGPCTDMRLEALRVDLRSGASGSGADAAAVEEGDNLVVFNAEVTGASADGIDFKASRVAVANVVVHDVARNGIKLWRGGDVINALVYNTGADAAIVFDQGGRYRILNSTIARHAWHESAYAGTVAYDQPTQPGQLEVINTIFYQNSGALWVSPAFGLDVRYSLFFGSSEGEVTWGDITVGEGFDPFAVLEKAGGGCCNPDVTDPQFVNPDRGDYRLGAGSPARDAGTTRVDAFPAFDLFGHPRLAGAGVDLGPIEAN